MTSLTLVAGMAWGIAAPGLKEAPKKDVPSIVGEWQLESILCQGVVTRDESFYFTFTADGKLKNSCAGLTKPEQTYTLGENKDVRETDWLLPSNGVVIHRRGIY